MRLERVPIEIQDLGEKIVKYGGYPYLVGGCVRDMFLGRASKDFDIEVFGLSPGLLSLALNQPITDVVGQFGVFKVKAGNKEIDISLPRTDSKTGEGHKGFEISVDPFMSFKEAARRRDFTINSMSISVVNGELVDLFNGLKDLTQKTLRIVDPHTFIEDPLRVLRGIQLI